MRFATPVALGLLVLGSGCGAPPAAPSPADRLTVTEREDGTALIRFCRAAGLLFCEEVRASLEVHHSGQSAEMTQSFGGSYTGIIEDVDRERPFVVEVSDFVGAGPREVEIVLAAPFDILEPSDGAAFPLSSAEIPLRWAPAEQSGAMSVTTSDLCSDAGEIRSSEIEGDPGVWRLGSSALPRIGDAPCRVEIALMRSDHQGTLSAFAGKRREVFVRGQQTRNVTVELVP